MRAVQAGIILTVVGLALFFASRHVAVEIEGGYVVFATVVTALGIGFLLSSIASFVLARTLGVARPLPPPDLSAPRPWAEPK
jgi:FtsH-binding integral membrane protein